MGYRTVYYESGLGIPTVGMSGQGGISLTPFNIFIPTISGLAQVGQTLTAATGTWTNTPTFFTYQWNGPPGTPIAGATASTYVPVAGDAGNMITVSVTATNTSGTSGPATSLPTGAVGAAGFAPMNAGLPTIS